MTAVMALVAWALALWGWGGLTVDIRWTDLQLAAALTSIDLPEGMIIELDPEEWNAAPPEVQARRILHEVGHGVGAFYYDDIPERYHSDDSESVMYTAYRPSQYITTEDRLTVFKNTRWWMPYRVTTAFISR